MINRKFKKVETYVSRIMDTVDDLAQHLTESTKAYVTGFIQNVPPNFDNSSKWKHMKWSQYNYRYGLHSSFIGLESEIIVEAILSRGGYFVRQLFENENEQKKSKIDLFAIKENTTYTGQVKTSNINRDGLLTYDSYFVGDAEFLFIRVKSKTIPTIVVLDRPMFKQLHESHRIINKYIPYWDMSRIPVREIESSGGYVLSYE